MECNIPNRLDAHDLISMLAFGVMVGLVAFDRFVPYAKAAWHSLFRALDGPANRPFWHEMALACSCLGALVLSAAFVLAALDEIWQRIQ